jgi:hypothetical protein
MLWLVALSDSASCLAVWEVGATVCLNTTGNMCSACGAVFVQVRFSLVVCGTSGSLEILRGGWAGGRGFYTLYSK